MGLAKFFGINGLKNLLSEYELNMTSSEKEFVKNKKIGCKKITNTVYSELNKHKYIGTYFEHPNRNHELDIYFKEAFLATVFASLGLTIYMVEENELESGTKIDAIMNNVPVDFKIYEKNQSLQYRRLKWQSARRKDFELPINKYNTLSKKKQAF